MSFYKKKIKNSSKISTQDIYSSIRKKNAISGFLLSVIAIIVVLFIGTTVLAKVSDFKFSIPLPAISLPSLSMFGLGDDSDAPKEVEKFNILITGIGGGIHDGADLTDSLMLASINRTTNTVALFSIPRDLYIEFPSGGKGKINETYLRSYKAAEAARKKDEKKYKKYFGSDDTSSETASDALLESKKLGMKALGEKVTEITGEKVNAFASVDFQGFAKFIDVLGGIEVDVPENLIDHQYPGEVVYETFSVKKGKQTFDGDTALKYVRSRHSTNDFDRSRRQQIIVRAVKDKLLSLGTLSSPSKIQKLYDTLSSHLFTNLSMAEMLSIAMFAKGLPSGHIVSFSLNDTCFQSVSACDRGGFLYTPLRENFGGLSVLLPGTATDRDVSNYSEIRRFANLVFNYSSMFLENYEINIINASKISGLANNVALDLKSYGFNIPEKNSILSTKDSYSGSTILYTSDPAANYGIPENSTTLKALSLFFSGSTESVLSPKYSKDPSPKIELILANDPKSKKK